MRETEKKKKKTGVMGAGKDQERFLLSVFSFVLYLDELCSLHLITSSGRSGVYLVGVK